VLLHLHLITSVRLRRWQGQVLQHLITSVRLCWLWRRQVLRRRRLWRTPVLLFALELLAKLEQRRFWRQALRFALALLAHLEHRHRGWLCSRLVLLFVALALRDGDGRASVGSRTVNV
jgi:hypothetical protein